MSQKSKIKSQNRNESAATHRPSAAEAGFVSIIVATLLMIILSLITVGFTQLMQREQRQAIDRQLSRTALYAAESGVNDVLGAIGSGAVGYGTSTAKTNCNVDGTGGFAALGPNGDGTLSADGSVAYTCALYDERPGALQFDNITANDSKVVKLEAASGNPFNSLTVTWGNPAGNNLGLLPGCSDVVLDNAQSRTGAPPIVRLDLTSLPTAPYTRDALLANTEYVYLAPCDGIVPGSLVFDPATAADVVRVGCTGTGDQSCEATINNLQSIPSDTFLVRIGAVYGTANVSISGVDSSLGDVEFLDAQVGVDVTARANDVVRRLRVSVPINRSVDVPEAALQVFEGVCKLLHIDPSPTTLVHDECVNGPPPPPVACGDSGKISIAAYAATFAAEPFADSFQTKIMDVLYNPTDPDGAGGTVSPGADHSPIAQPQVPLDTGGISLNLAPSGCDYSIDYVSFCAFVDPDGPDAGLPPTDCFVGPNEQPAEAARLEFYGAHVGTGLNLECDIASGLMGYVDTNDLSDIDGDGMWDQSSWGGGEPSLPLVRTGLSGPVRCMRIVHACVANPAPFPSCGSPLAFTSVHMEEIDWNASPSAP